MNVFYRCLLICAFVSAASFADSQMAVSSPDTTPVSCSPAPCVLPPTQASEGGGAVTGAVIVADPANPSHLLIGSSDVNCIPESNVGFHLSSDGGSDWTHYCLPPVHINGVGYSSNGTLGFVASYDHNGVAYIGGPYGSEQNQQSFEGFSKSSDGMNWSTPAPAVARRNWVPGYCWMAADTNAGSPYVNSVYIACAMEGPSNQVVVSRSRDGGATWHQVNVTSARQFPDIALYTDLTVGGNGSLYLVWMYCNSGPFFDCEDATAYMVFAKSNDGGVTWSAPRLVAKVALVPSGVIPNTHVMVVNNPAIAVDNSNEPYAGNLYVVMYNWTGTFIEVQLVRSIDGGETWSKPILLAPGITHDQFFPWISVSPTGLVGASWLDRRNDPANISYQAFAAISADGGRTFQPTVQLTQGFSNPNTGANGPSMGNFTANTWDGPNYFIAAWMDDSKTQFMQDVVGGIRLK